MLRLGRALWSLSVTKRRKRHRGGSAQIDGFEIRVETEGKVVQIRANPAGLRDREIPPPGEVFSGAAGKTLEEAASGVPHGTIRATTAGDIRRGGGTVTHAPERTRSGAMNDKHVNICRGSGPCSFGPPVQNPVPKSGRAQ